MKHDFQLNIRENAAPLIVDKPLSQNAQPGRRIVFVCRAIGEPTPQISWLFNGNEIDRSDLHISVNHININIFAFFIENF